MSSRYCYIVRRDYTESFMLLYSIVHVCLALHSRVVHRKPCSKCVMVITDSLLYSCECFLSHLRILATTADK